MHSKYRYTVIVVFLVVITGLYPVIISAGQKKQSLGGEEIAYGVGIILAQSNDPRSLSRPATPGKNDPATGRQGYRLVNPFRYRLPKHTEAAPSLLRGQYSTRTSASY